MVDLLGWIGRTTRRSFVLIFAIALVAGFGVVAVTFGASGRGAAGSSWLVFLLAGLGLLAVGWVQLMAVIRRLHDFGRSGWYAAGLIVLAAISTVPVADALGRLGLNSLQRAFLGVHQIAAFLAVAALAFLMFRPGERAANRFGIAPGTRPATPAVAPVQRAKPVLPRPRAKRPSRIPAGVPVRMAPPPRTAFGQRQVSRAKLRPWPQG